MRAIALETSGRLGSAAAVRDGVVVAEQSFPHGLKHAAGLLPLVDQLCRAEGWRPAEVEHVYVSVGPGSFTGLRIGVTLAKTLALVTGAKIVAVPSLRALAENAPTDARHVVLVIDAKRDAIFTARFDRPSPDAPWVEAEGARLDSLSAMLSRSPRPVHLLGEGLPHHEKFLPADDPGVIVTPPDLWPARAGAVAKLGAELAAAGAFADPFVLAPLYVRKPEAEEKADAAVRQIS
ncbi:MAG TPA: tRNA (adenosine(37)-N6)-threonylcarbamoyltransferase complex dimerization subunit type 1 TsaB [Tepidisphaeraceae bacterium]|nr:tRNA (adenosine(37)-N6)-threonylcarbamoyltransferase complex dimerization subunit type 1 TsaB [Tepidisphaeraceae bacterium]